jgi:ferric iron reductase protein FhuF
VLWGNIGSAANSAARLISTARSDLTIAAHTAADGILTDPRIDGGALRAGPLFRRRSCCLIYRIANTRTATCGDCILR